MYEKAEFGGRPYWSALIYLLLGIFGLMLGGLFSGLHLLYNNPPHGAVLFTILGGAFLLVAARRLRKRTVVLDALAIDFLTGGKLVWSVPWIQVKAIGNGTAGHITAVYCIGIRTDGRDYRLTDGTDLGPEKKFRALFLELARLAKNRKITVEDRLCWEAESRHPKRSFEERLTGTWQMELPKDIDTAIYENKWLIGRDYTNIPVFLATLIPSILGIVFFCWAACAWEPVIAFILFSAAAPIICMIVAMGAYAWMVRITHVYFDNERITLRQGSGKDKTLRWMHLRRCRFDTDTRRLEISSDFGNFLILLDEQPTMAICKRFTVATGRRPHIFDSRVSDLLNS